MQFSSKSVCLTILIHIGTRQNKFEGHISKNVAKMAILWPKIASATVARAWHGHNLAIFHPILTNEYTKMNCSSRRIEWNKKLLAPSPCFRPRFPGPIPAPRPHMGNAAPTDAKPPQIAGTRPGHPGQLTSQKNPSPKNQS